jgi:hypothetical protein
MARDMIQEKVYGSVWPAGQDMLRAAATAIGEEWVELEGDLLRIAYEGPYCDAQELADAIAPHLTPDCQGRIDHIDMDAWRLTRYLITGTEMKKSSAGLNHVLAYSGH